MLISYFFDFMWNSNKVFKDIKIFWTVHSRPSIRYQGKNLDLYHFLFDIIFIIRIRQSFKQSTCTFTRGVPRKKLQSIGISLVSLHAFTKTLKSNISEAYKVQKQPPRGVPRKRCSENMQQINRRTPVRKCDFNKVATAEVRFQQSC